MNLKDRFISSMAEAGYTKKAAGHIFTELMNDIGHALVHEGEARLPGVGTLKTTQRAARTGHNPLTGEKIDIPAKTAVKFTAVKELREALN